MKKECVTKCVVKRKGHVQHYEEKKVYASVYAAALNCENGEEKSEKLAKEITKKISTWVKKKNKVSSLEIRNQIAKSIRDRDVRLMYESHLDLS